MELESKVQEEHGRQQAGRSHVVRPLKVRPFIIQVFHIAKYFSVVEKHSHMVYVSAHLSI